MKKNSQYKYLQVRLSSPLKVLPFPRGRKSTPQYLQDSDKQAHSRVESVPRNLQTRVLHITLDREDKLNALHPEMIHSLLRAFRVVNSDSSICAVVLRGKGKAFCSGADLKCLTDKKSFSKKDLDSLFTLLEKIDTSPVPVIARVHGFIMGGGIGLISVCDIVCAERGAQFQFSETQLALVPSIISPFIVKKISASWARFFMLSGIAFDAKEAMVAGFVHFIAKPKQCDVYLKFLLERLSRLDNVAVSETKRILKEVTNSSFKKYQSKVVQSIDLARSKPAAQRRIKKLLKKN